jgi:beta-glucanase (GH16 family)
MMEAFRIRWHTFVVRFAIAAALGVAAGCASGGSSAGSIYTPPPPPSITPIITATAALNGAQVVSFSDAVSGVTIYYTVDGSTPTTASTQYLAPFLVTSSVTINSLAVSSTAQSSVVSKALTLNIPSGTLVWGDDFTNTTGANQQPDPTLWTYDTGASGFGNMELEDYCAWASNVSPCNSANPNAYVGTDNALHIIAEKPSSGVYTSARLKTQGLFSLSYGRLEARMMIPEGQGLWPAFWLMGNNFATAGWPICGEQDIMEHINSPSPDYVMGSVHMPSINSTSGNSTHWYNPTGFSAAGWHIYGMIWTKGQVQFYVDSPGNIYANYTAANFAANGATWPFDSGNSNFILLNLSVGGNLPGSPNSSTPFPSQLLVDYVHLYTN